MIIHIIVSTLVVPPNVNRHNKCIWTRAYYLLQDIEHRNDKPHVFCVTIIWWHLEADDCGMDALWLADGHDKDAEEVANDEAIARIQAIRDGHVETLAKDPTASVWVQYLDTSSFRAERLWPLAVCKVRQHLSPQFMANLPNDLMIIL